MKKIIPLSLLVLINLNILCSCFESNEESNEVTILELKNVTWKNDDFNINVSSDTLRKQNDELVKPSADDYYTTITVRDEIYSCIIMIDYNSESYYGNIIKIELINIIDNSIINYKNETNDCFIYCSYYISDFYDYHEYRYVMDCYLSTSCQYYEYCKTNNKFCPYHITFYGYENEE